MRTGFEVQWKPKSINNNNCYRENTDILMANFFFHPHLMNREQGSASYLQRKKWQRDIHVFFFVCEKNSIKLSSNVDISFTVTFFLFALTVPISPNDCARSWLVWHRMCSASYLRHSFMYVIFFIQKNQSLIRIVLDFFILIFA